MSFRPSLHGWPFANRFPTDGIRSPASPAPGLGAGMCLTALDRYLAGIGMPEEASPPEPGSPVYEELRARQAAALDSLRREVLAAQVAPDGSWRDRVPLPLSGRDAASTTRAAWRAARASIDRGTPAVLTLVAAADGYSRGHAAWQVLAYAHAREGARVTLSIYDPAHPDDDEQRLAFSTRGPLDARVTGGLTVRAFLHRPYDRSPAPTFRAETFADRAVIGLNRKVDGRVSAVAGRRLDLVARDGEGNLLHFHRQRGRAWEGRNVTEQDELEGSQLYGDPVAVRAFGILHAFSRSYVGDLLHFRLGRGWSVANRTDQKRAGPRFRLEGQPVPVVGGRGSLHVFGRGAEGTLVHLESSPLRPWVARDIGTQAPIADEPVAARVGDEIHVLCRTRDHHLLHIGPGAGGLISVDLTAAPGSAGTLRFDASPALLVEGGRLHAIGRSPEGELVHAERAADGRWSGGKPGTRIVGDPIGVEGPAGLHVFATSKDGTLLHGWRSRGTWQVEDLGLRADPGAPAALVGWGGQSELGVVRLVDATAWLLTWRPDTDWTASPLRARAGVHDRHLPHEGLMVARDSAGRAHAFGTDLHGTVVHVEPGGWAEPGPGRVPGWGGETALRPAPIGFRAVGVARAERSEAPGPTPEANAAARPAPEGEATKGEVEPAAKGEATKGEAKPAAKGEARKAAKAAAKASPEPATADEVEADAARAKAEKPPRVAAGAEPAGRSWPEDEPAPSPREEAEAGAESEVPVEAESRATAEPEFEPLDLTLIEDFPQPPRSLRRGKKD